MTGEGVFLCGRERGGVLTGREKERDGKREREQSDPSCGEDTQEKCIPQAASTRKAAKQSRALTTSFKSLHHNDRLLLTSLGPAGSLRWFSLCSDTYTHRQQQDSRLCCACIGGGFHRVGRSGSRQQTRYREQGSSQPVSVRTRRDAWVPLQCVGSFSEVKYVPACCHYL